MSANAPQPPGPQVWQAQSLRLVVFPTESPLQIDQDWWQAVVGREAETVTRKRVNHEYSGPFEGFSLTLTLDAFRVQWLLSPLSIDPERLEEWPPVLGNFLEREQWFGDRLRDWIPQCPGVTRIGVSGTLLQPVETGEAGYERLNQYLRCVDLDVNSTDFLYRINRKVQSQSVADLWINRLMTWSVGKIDVELRTRLWPGLEGSQQRLVQGIRFVCALEYDVNTVPAPEGQTFPAESLQPVHSELRERARQIAVAGDVGP